jgi:dTDP-glucose pyrophosphorylase
MRVNLIPLAGKGKRFTDEGYTIPKPVIPINGTPVVIAAANSLPAAEEYIFICLEEHLKKHHIDQTIKEYFPKAIIVPIDHVTEGQTSTCVLAEKYIDPESELTIGACDNGMTYDQAAYNKVIKDAKTDAIIWTFRNNPNVLRHPEHWGWVSADKNNSVRKVTVKVPVSEKPIQDHAVVGCFSFKKARYFFDMAKKMIADNRRINNEFYNDECMNVLIENGLRVKVFEIDTYLGWGTPADLKTYEYWNSFFKDRNHG